MSDTPTAADKGAAKTRVALVFGGRSSEHAISCVSAGSVLAAIDRDRYDIVPIGISLEGRWVLAADDPARLEITDGRLPTVDGSESSVVLSADPTSQLMVSEPGQVPSELGQVDVVFPLLHGPFGEDGTLQGLLELAGIPYVGSGVFASAAGMDKGHMKALLQVAGVPMGPYELISPREWRTSREAALHRVQTKLDLPVFVKPCRAGSSIGITKVKTWDELEAAIEVAAGHDPRVLVETAIRGQEIEVGVLEGRNGGAPDASVCLGIHMSADHEFFDFEAKYLDGATNYDIPAKLPEPIAEQVRELACVAFETLGCEGLARVDFFVDEDGTILLNELNTMPGFTDHSKFALMWAATDVGYAEMIDRLLQTALARGTGLR